MPIRKGKLKLVKDFFGFGRKPERIIMILPSIPQNRRFSLVCKNYPKFKYAISPDDMFSTIRIHSLLTSIYGEIVEVYDHKNIPENIDFHRIIIGGPPTNVFSKDLLKGLPIHFGDNNVDRTIRFKKSKGQPKTYKIKFSPKVKSQNELKRGVHQIRRDYCIISRNKIHDKVVFVIAGLRAYGQLGVYYFLNTEGFYEKVQRIVQSDCFQILIQVDVWPNEKYGGYEIIEQEKIDQQRRPKLFISYVRQNIKKVKHLKELLEAKGIETWLDTKSLKPGQGFEKEIKKAILNSDFFLACFSKAYEKRQESWMNLELDIAAKKNKKRQEYARFIIPVKLTACDIPTDIADIDIGHGNVLSSLTIIDLYKDEAEAIKKIIGFIQDNNVERLKR